MFAGVYSGRRVLVTGHTGFKGAWLVRWLGRLGAATTGYALPPPTYPSLFASIDWGSGLDHVIGDVREARAVAELIKRVRPEVIFHLAAQPLVRRSHAEPVDTFATNVLGTVHVLEAVRQAGGPCAVVVVTSDKCYEPAGDGRAHHEKDPLGGSDPYAASKACVEIATSAYARSFFSPGGSVALATARAGNVIGGGDWAEDRIVPDCVRALSRGEPVRIRHPEAVRPWQHVLEPLSGYLWLGAKLWRAVSVGDAMPSPAFNFGPAPNARRPVRALVEEVLRHWPGSWEAGAEPGDPPESEFLWLATGRAARELGWKPVWNFPTAVARTVRWYRAFLNGAASRAAELVDADIEAYALAASRLRAVWSTPP